MQQHGPGKSEIRQTLCFLIYWFEAYDHFREKRHKFLKTTLNLKQMSLLMTRIGFLLTQRHDKGFVRRCSGTVGPILKQFSVVGMQLDFLATFDRVSRNLRNFK
jgi:hypothetical protein